MAPYNKSSIGRTWLASRSPSVFTPLSDMYTTKTNFAPVVRFAHSQNFLMLRSLIGSDVSRTDRTSASTVSSGVSGFGLRIAASSSTAVFLRTVVLTTRRLSRNCWSLYKRWFSSSANASSEQAKLDSIRLVSLPKLKI